MKIINIINTIPFYTHAHTRARARTYKHAHTHAVILKTEKYN